MIIVFQVCASSRQEDRGDSGVKFKRVCEAYDTLNNPEKRKIYDHFGKQGVQQTLSQGVKSRNTVDELLLLGTGLHGQQLSSSSAKLFERLRQDLDIERLIRAVNTDDRCQQEASASPSSPFMLSCGAWAWLVQLFCLRCFFDRTFQQKWNRESLLV